VTEGYNNFLRLRKGRRVELSRSRGSVFVERRHVRGWHKLFEQRGIEGLTSFDVGGSASFLSAVQEEALKAFVDTTPPRSTRQVGAWIGEDLSRGYSSGDARF
jgi:hypothetical protein